MKRIITIFLIGILISVVGYGVARALPGEGLTISPPISELTLEAGESQIKTIRLTNPTDNLVEVYPRIMNFRAAGEGGEPDFYEDGNDSDSFSVAKWISFSQSKIALAPEQVVEFKYTIEVPKDAEPGGHYGVVFFATEPPRTEDGPSQVALGSMIGSLVLVTVPGQIVEKGFIEEFKTDKKIYFTSPTNLFIRIANLGNVHFKPEGKISIKGWFGSPEKPLIINEQKGNVLPESTRRFNNEWKFSNLAFGYFKATADVSYSGGARNLTNEVSFWIIPWWLMVLVLLVVVGVIALIVIRKKSKKSSKKTKPNSENQRTPQNPQRPLIR